VEISTTMVRPGATFSKLLLEVLRKISYRKFRECGSSFFISDLVVTRISSHASTMIPYNSDCLSVAQQSGLFKRNVTRMFFVVTGDDWRYMYIHVLAQQTATKSQRETQQVNSSDRCGPMQSLEIWVIGFVWSVVVFPSSTISITINTAVVPQRKEIIITQRTTTLTRAAQRHLKHFTYLSSSWSSAFEVI